MERFVIKLWLCVYLISLQSATTTLSITVTDINDNSPVFTSKAPYVFSVRENQNNEFVGTVSATDADMGNNAEMKYSVPANNG